MAEAVRPSKAKERTARIEREKEDSDDAGGGAEAEETGELTDDSLQRRLRSLTSFVNNLEPTAPSLPPDERLQTSAEPVQASAPPPAVEAETNAAAATTAYYEMVSEQARQRTDEAASFSALSRNLTEVAKSSTASAPQNLLQADREDEPLASTSQRAAAAVWAPAMSVAQARPASASTTVDYNQDKISQLNKLSYPRLSWNRTVVLSTNNATQTIDALVDEELTRFFEQDQLCKELEIYYKSKIVQTEHYEATVNDFVSAHSMLNEYQHATQTQRKHEFFELLRDYYEARGLVAKCLRYVNAFKWECIANQMRKIWSFEKYTIESFGQCGDQQRVKHELTSEKAYFNKMHSNKLQTMLYELRFNLVKCGLVSSQFCSKLARSKLESYLHDFLIQLMKTSDAGANSDAKGLDFDSYSSLNSELRVLIDILFYFHRKQNKPSSSLKTKTASAMQTAVVESVSESGAAKSGDKNDDQQYDNELIVDQLGENYQAQSSAFSTSLDDETDETIIQNDQVFRRDVQDWLKILISLLVYNTERQRRLSLIGLNSKASPGLQASSSTSSASTVLSYQWANLHFDNIFFCLGHLLRSPDSYISSVSFLFQYPLLLFADSPAAEGSSGHHAGASPAAVASFMRQLGLDSSQSDPLVNFYFDFYLKLFAVFAHDVKYRKQFLFLSAADPTADDDYSTQHSLPPLGEGPSGAGSSANWQLVDLDGDLESVEQMLVEISEDDLVKLYYQIPVNALFAFLWQYLKLQPGDATAAATGARRQDGAEFRKRYVALKVVSFLDHLAKLSIRTLLTYNRAKYKNFAKLVGKTLKDCVRFSALVCGHMSGGERRTTTTPTPSSSKLSPEPGFSSVGGGGEFQQHYDHFVKRLFTTIIYSTRMRSMRWTILSQLNIGSLCLRTKWILLSIMCGIDVYHPKFVDLFSHDLPGGAGGNGRRQTRSTGGITPKDYILQACQNDLESLLAPVQPESASDGQRLTEIELLSFLKTLHFLVVARSEDSAGVGEEDRSAAGEQADDASSHWTEIDEIEFAAATSDASTTASLSAEDEEQNEFMVCVVKVLFRIAYCFEATKEVCHKEGNALFFAICSAHPRLIGVVLREIDGHLSDVGKSALYLSSELPFHRWLSHVNCEGDVAFLRRCLLANYTNSVLFRLAMNCIDNLDFDQSTRRTSFLLREDWLQRNGGGQASSNHNRWLLGYFNNQQTKFDLSVLVRIKLCVVLFELHSRLTNYNYFVRTTTPASSTEPVAAPTGPDGEESAGQATQHPQVFLAEHEGQGVARDDLNAHYSRLPKDKRLALVTWIWTTLNRMNVFVCLDSMDLVEYLEELSLIYASAPRTQQQQQQQQQTKTGGAQLRLPSQRYLTRFYRVYLNVKTANNEYEMMPMATATAAAATSADEPSSSSTGGTVTAAASVQTVLQPRCPLECYLKLVFTRYGHDLNFLCDNSTLELVQTILSAQKRHGNDKLQQITYTTIFNWLENLVFKYSQTRIVFAGGSGEARSAAGSFRKESLINDFRLKKQMNLSRISNLLVLLFNPALSSSAQVVDKYCAQILKRLISFDKLDQRLQANSSGIGAASPNGPSLARLFKKQNEENFTNYLNFWIEVLVSSVRSWHRYKNVVRIIDFLISYAFEHENTKQYSNRFINPDLFEEFMSFVRVDFGIVASANVSTYLLSGANDSTAAAAAISTSASSSSSASVSVEPGSSPSQNSGGSWIPPSLSWFTSSLTYVVSATASQVGETLGAAIGAVGIGSSGAGANSEFESNLQQQFTYDKRLYKEFPFVGFYLSLCEERIEAQLSIWTIFRSYLLGVPLDHSLFSAAGIELSAIAAAQPSPSAAQSASSTASFVESCWRKTLSLVNKVHNLQLGFSPQRLMLFKWCERALELPVDHPLLILYWQKFFNIYLDKEFYSSLSLVSPSKNELPLQSAPQRAGSSPFDLELTATNAAAAGASDSTQSTPTIQSPTLKLFMSSSQLNSLLKQMKKQLELTSEHFAYKCHTQKPASSSGDSPTSSGVVLLPSAPVSNFHYNEFISKLYYALSLWVDETRLHDPSIYLPALPAHYEPNLLAKVFARHADLWIQYVDMNKLTSSLRALVHAFNKENHHNQWTMRSSEQQRVSKSNGDVHDEARLFFRQPDRLVVAAPSLAQLSIKFQSAIKDKFGPSIETLLQPVAGVDQSAASGAVAKSPPNREEIQLILQVSEHLLVNILKYNNETINHQLNNMHKLDDKLTNKLLLHLWHNEMCEKYVQVPCTSLINPMHQCKRAAMVKFVYEIATKRDQVRQEIKENRQSYEKILTNFMEAAGSSASAAAASSPPTAAGAGQFPSDDVVRSMVAMNQLIKRLLRIHHVYQQQQQQQASVTSGKGAAQAAFKSADSANQMLLTRLFNMLIDLYESHMRYPYDVLSKNNTTTAPAIVDPAQQQNFSWTFLLQQQQSSAFFNIDVLGAAGGSGSEQQPLNADSIQLYFFDLIHLIGSNFIQTAHGSPAESANSTQLRKRNQQILLEKIIQKLTSTVTIVNNKDTPPPMSPAASGSPSGSRPSSATPGSSSSAAAASANGSSSSSSSSSHRRSMHALLSANKNKLTLMSLCAQYVEPYDLELFNEFYMNILCSITSILINEIAMENENASAQAVTLSQYDTCEILNKKFSIVLQLLSKFSFVNLSRLLQQNYKDISIKSPVPLYSSSSKATSPAAAVKSTPAPHQSSNVEEEAGAEHEAICTNFVETNINFLIDLKLESLSAAGPTCSSFVQQVTSLNESNLRLIINQCIDNFVSILNVNYPHYFEYMLKKCLEFSARPLALKYGTRHLKQFNTIFQQHEILLLYCPSPSQAPSTPQKTRQQSTSTSTGNYCLLRRDQFEATFRFLNEFFNFERNKFRASKLSSFYSHWSSFGRQIADISKNLFSIYFERYVLKELQASIDAVRRQFSAEDLLGAAATRKQYETRAMEAFERGYDALWSRLTELFAVWIEPSSIAEISAQALINVKEIVDAERASANAAGSRDYLLGGGGGESSTTSPGAAVIYTIDAFLSTFHSIYEKLVFLTNGLGGGDPTPGAGSRVDLGLQQSFRNYALNKFFRFYYEQLASELTASSSVNDNVLDCYHKCINKYASTWFGRGLFEPDYCSINIMNELCESANPRLIRFLAFDVVAYLDLARISESYFRQAEITPAQINDLLKCWLQLLAEFCLRDSIRESSQFDALLRPIYNQAEILQCWSMLSDASYEEVIINRFCKTADYHYAFASRGTDKGLLMNLLKSAAEFYSLVDRNSLSCFSSAKRRCYLKALCELLLKPSAATIKTDYDSFQNCIMNLFTDIETFSVTACDDSNKSLKHEIQLLIDECLCLVVSGQSTGGGNQEATQIYSKIFETWLGSSKDSPILLHFVNRISRNYNLLTHTYSSDKYCHLIELCLDVYFETNRCLIYDNETFNSSLSLTSKEAASAAQPTSPELLEQFLTTLMLKENGQEPSPSWKLIMEDIDFKLNGSSNFVELCKKSSGPLPDTSADDEACVDLFEYRCLQHSSYLFLYAYIHQRVAIFRATFGSDKSLDFNDVLLKYTGQMIKIFLTNSVNLNQGVFIKPLGGFLQSKPKQTKEEKFILILNKILEFHLSVMYNCNSHLLQSRVGEQLVQLSSLLHYYGEDTLSNQNPLNDGQSLGSDLLATIGLNILAKKSQFSLQFRFYCRCMAICLLKQILIVSESEIGQASPAAKSEAAPVNVLFPTIPEETGDSRPPANLLLLASTGKQHLYKVRMSHADLATNSDRQASAVNMANLMASVPPSQPAPLISCSLPAASNMSPPGGSSKSSAAKTSAASSSSSSPMQTAYNEQFKQAAYQFHLLFQNKAYTSSATMLELANHINQQLQSAQASQHFCLPQVYNLSRFLCSKLFKDKFYLF